MSHKKTRTLVFSSYFSQLLSPKTQQNKLMEKGLIWPPSLRVQERSWQQDHDTAGHCVSAVRRQRAGSAGA